MMMSNDEITASYREAKDKRSQIRILAELNACDIDKIKDILTQAGLEIPKRAYRAKKERSEAQIAADEVRREKALARSQKGKQMVENTQELPDFVQEALTKELIAITEQVETLTQKAQAIREYMCANNQAGQQA